MGHYKEQYTAMEEDELISSISPSPEVQEEPSISYILDERGSRYGEFINHAALSQTLKNTIMQHYLQTHGGNEAQPLPAYMVESISMICHKLARIANGDPTYSDSWIDIEGYARLVVEQLDGKSRSGN